MNTYYINGASTIEDGTTPETGYHNFSNMWVALDSNYWISQGVNVLQDGDIIECVQGDMAEETEPFLFFYLNGDGALPSSDLFVRSLATNAERPRFHLVNNAIYCLGGVKFIGLDFYGTPPQSLILSFGGMPDDVFSADGSRFFDCAIMATPGGGS